MENEKYRRGQIYTIRNIKDDTMIYVGSTIDNLSKRFYKHKLDCKRSFKVSLYSYIIDNDWTDWYIELYEMYPCNNKKELNRREGEIIREIGTINKNIAGRTQKEWYEYNKEKVSQYHKEWNEKNKEHIAKQKNEYRKNNKETILQKGKEYYENNKENISHKHKEYYENNKEKIKEIICCDICGAFSTKYHLKRHQRTKKCMEALNITTSNTQDCE